MSVRFRTPCLSAGMLLIAVSGCYSYNPYGYPAPYPGMAPTSTYQPGVGALPQTLSANPALATPAYDSGASWQQSRSSSGVNAELGAASDQFEPPASDNSVPEYNDPNSDAFFNDSSSDARGTKAPTQAIPRSGEHEDIFGNGNEFGALDAGEIDPAAEAFLEPVPVKQVSHATAQSDQPSPYDYEPTGLRWLRGKVDYDRQDGAWHLIYDLTPDPGDPYGGSITLVPDERLEGLREDDVVLVEGSVDDSVVDRLGKPRYRPTGVFPLVPENPTGT